MGRAYEVRKLSKEKTGAIKAKTYSLFAKEIYLIAKTNPNIESNSSLKRIVDKAKKSQVPANIIERAIGKAKGNSNENYETVTYEGFGPGESTLIIKCLTDNINRTVGFIRGTFNKFDKSLGVNCSVSYNYDHLAIISIKSNEEEKIFELLLENNIEIIDIENEEGYITITAHPNDAHKIKDLLESIIPNIDYVVDEIGMYPKTKIKLSDEDKTIFEKLIKILEESEDIVEIYHNVDIIE